MATLQRAPTRPLRTASVDYARWNDLAPRDDDIVIATYPKCGTTWTQRIVDLLVFQDPAPRPVFKMSVWLDARFFAEVEEDLATLEAQKHRRFIKSHLPFDALPVYDAVKYIHVARDGRDAFLSWHNHILGTTPALRGRIGAIAAADPELTGPPPPPTPEDPREFFQQWIANAEQDRSEATRQDVPYFDFENTYWAERHRDNLLLVHYGDLKADLPGEMRRISQFLGIDTPEDRLAELAAAASFEAMKTDGEALMPDLKQAFDRGTERFLNKGVNGRWRDVLTDEDLARYQALVERKLSPSLAAWLERGRLLAGDPRAMAD